MRQAGIHKANAARCSRTDTPQGNRRYRRFHRNGQSAKPCHGHQSTFQRIHSGVCSHRHVRHVVARAYLHWSGSNRFRRRRTSSRKCLKRFHRTPWFSAYSPQNRHTTPYSGVFSRFFQDHTATWRIPTLLFLAPYTFLAGKMCHVAHWQPIERATTATYGR